MKVKRKNVLREEIGERSILIMDPYSDQEIVAIHIFLKMGSVYETEEDSGVSNLMQNLLLKGTELMDGEELDRTLDSLGSKLVSSTGKEAGSISLLTTRGKLRDSLNLMSEVLTRPAMSVKEFEKERELALDEVRQRKDDLLAHTLDLFQDAFYGSHPLHKTVQGSEEAIEALKLEDVEAFRRRVYCPAKMVFSCAGNFEPDMVRGISTEIVARLDETADEEKSGGESKVLGTGRDGDMPHGEEQEHRNTREERDSSAAWIVLGYPAPSFGDDGYHEMQVVNAALGGSMDSRLFSRLREEKGLAYQVSSVYRAYEGPSFLAGYIGTDPRRYEEAVRALSEEVERVSEEVPRGEELKRTKEYLKGVFLIGGETMSSRAARRGRFEISGVGCDYGETYLKKIDDVTVEGLKDVAAKHFQQYSLGAIVPRGAAGQRDPDSN